MLRWYCAALLLFGFICFSAVLSCDDDDNDDNDDHYNIQPGLEAWTDKTSGLTWQVSPPEQNMTWDEALDYCDSLTLDGGGWHLPTISELRSLIRGCPQTETDGNCNISDSCLASSCQNNACDGCAKLAGPGPEGRYWPEDLPGNQYVFLSSSEGSDSDTYSWVVNFNDGGIGSNGIGGFAGVRCVR